MKLRLKMPLFMALLILVPMLALGYSSYKSSELLEHAVITKEAMEDASSGVKKIFDEYEIVLDDLINNEEMKFQTKTFTNKANEAFLNMPEINDLVKTTYYEEFLSEYEGEYEYLLNTYFATEEGEFYLSNIPPGEVDLTEYDPRQREWYTSAVAKKGEVIWTQPYMDTGTGKSTITLAKAIVDEKGEVIAVAGLDFDMSLLAHFIREHVLKEFLVVGIASLVVGILLVYLLVRRILKDVESVQNGMRTVANGDLSLGEVKTLNKKDEIGQLAKGFNVMVSDLRGLVSNVMEASEQVAATSEELTANAEETAKATEQITNSIQEVSNGADVQVSSIEKSMNQIGLILNDVEKIQESSDSVSESSHKAEEQVDHGKDTVNQAVEQMNVINQNTKEISNVVNSLSTRSNEIEKILTIINDIAEQTNLLALNAAIEAARAGEHGRGFAVVADEVRKLAEQSGNSTKQISELIREIQESTREAVNSMKKGEEAVNKGTELVDGAGGVFMNISETIDHIVLQMKGVAGSVEEISTNTSDLVESMGSVSEVSEHTSGHAQEVAASAEEQTASMEEVTAATQTLSSMAMELQELSAKFKIS
ncbi:methyl-accepting chemotaxis protein (plasmid) [Rossellomorea sp. AcN35-11]|nr:methyl-accepting chemotaxis protein [Rossellomorea aquimaris]WJV32148.1 methyl-accepting chemotaxis protein [Rossellomorea sp. AcN35-11]